MEQKNVLIAKNTIFLYIRLAFILFVSLYTTRTVLNVLGIEDYGVYNVVAGFVSLFSFLNASMSSCAQRFYNYNKGTDGEKGMMVVFNTSVIIQCIIMIISFVILETFGVWYINNKMVIPIERLIAANWLFQFSVINLILVIFQIPFVSAIIACEKMNYYSLVSIIDILLKLVLVLILPYVSYDKLIFYGSLTLIIGIFNFIMYTVYAKKKFDFIKIFHGFNKELFKQMLSFTSWTILDTLAYILKGQGLNVLLNAFCGTIVNAARGIAYQISNALSGFQSNIIVAFKPQLIQSYAENKTNRTKELMYSSSKISFIFLATLIVPIIIDLDYILNLWLKGVVPEYTVTFTILVLIDMLLSSLNTPISVTVQATGKIRSYQIIRSLITLSILPISWFCIRLTAEPSIVFIISLVITVIVQPVSMVLLRKVFSYSYKEYSLKVLFPCLLYSVLVPIIPYYIKLFLPEGIVRLVIIIFVSIFVSISLSIILVLDKKEKSMIKTIIRNILHMLFNRN